MKKILIAFIFYFFTTCVAQGQNTWLRVFAEEYEPTFDNVARSLAYDDDYIYFIAGSAYPTSDPNYTPFSLKSVFYKVDMNGNLILKKYLSEGYNPYWYSFVNLKMLSDGNLLAYGNYKTVIGTFPHFVMKLSKEGEVIWVNYLPTYAGNGTIADIEELEDGSIVLLGFGWDNIVPGKAQIYKISANGDILWNKLVPNPVGFFHRRWSLATLVVLPETGDILFPSQLYITGSSLLDCATVTKLDSMGNYKWDRCMYIQPRELGGVVMDLLPDGNLVFAATVDTSDFGLWPVYRKIAKIDTSAQILWEYEEPVKGSNLFVDIKVTDVGDILLSGENSYGNPFTDPEGYTSAGNIVKISGEGELLWDRYYKLSDNVLPSNNPITKTELLPDGGILAIGYSGRFTPVNYDVLLMKLDSNGCLDAATCDTFNLITGIKDEEIESWSRFQLYPNPSPGEFYIDFPQGYNRLDVAIYNELGQLVKRYHQVTGHRPLYLEKKGIYFISLTQNGRKVASKTVLIE